MVLGSLLDGRGALRVMSLGSSSLSVLGKAAPTARALKCCTFAAAAMETRLLATGDFEGNLAQWDLERVEKVRAALLNVFG